ncbi:DUF4007 family protein [Rhodococcus sp. MEB041]|uniref:DUF4007 family protein n=1 Tax=Rhodococcus sp. MEB041 TaxID=3040323 RepID=UPI00254DD137|nr:DUF4007 family protein [Rhodococcus sp. MEB041]
MSIELAAAPSFANHQTFHPRFGWIKKGFDAALANPNVFNAPESPVTLGVGKNMVEAIRFWTLSVKVITREPHPDSPRQSIYVPTKLGSALFDDSVGLDPYSEDLSTLWILHWHAVSARSNLPIWRLTFNDFSAIDFSDKELTAYVADEVAATTWNQPKLSSIQKDVDCLLRMYSRRELRGRQTIDELIDSPFRELQLIQSSPGRGGRYRFVRGEKAGLPHEAITYCCLDYMSREANGSRTTSINRLATDPGSPGRLLKISEDQIRAAIESTAKAVPSIRLARPAGASQLAVDMEPEYAALAVLLARHSARRPDLLMLENLEVAGHRAMEPALSGREVRRKLGAVANKTTAGKKGSAA